MPIEPGDVIAGKYRVERTLGEGGMGVVLLATHLTLGKPRAIKLLRAEVAASADACRRFLWEAQAASDLESEHVARVFDVDQLPGGQPYIVMEHLVGRDLAAILAAHGPIPAAEAALYARQACEALAEAHAHGIVHRDIKPQNLFLTRRLDGSPSIKVLDFGIAKALTPTPDRPGITAEGAFLGTLQYTSPEQMTCARDVDARTDLWALGVVMYELVTGRVPFDSKSALQMFALVTEAAVPPPSDFTELPPGFEEVLLRCLAKDRAERPASADALRAMLDPFARAGASAVDRLAPLGSTPSRAPPPPRTTVASSAFAVDEAPSVPIASAPSFTRPRVNRGQAAMLLGVVVTVAWLARQCASGSASHAERLASTASTSAEPPQEPLAWTATAVAPDIPRAPTSAEAVRAPTSSASVPVPPPKPPPSTNKPWPRSSASSEQRPPSPKAVVFDAEGNPLPE